MDDKGSIPFDNPKGQEIKAALDILIENIYTTPFEDDNWFNSLVVNLLKHYGYEFKCHKSKLMDKPL